MSESGPTNGGAPQERRSGEEGSTHGTPAPAPVVRSSTPPEGFLRGWMWFGVANTVASWVGVLGYYLAAAGHWQGGAMLLLLGMAALVLAFFGVIVAAAWWRSAGERDALRGLLAHGLAFLAVPALIVLFVCGYKLSL